VSIGAHPKQHQATQTIVLKADVEVHAVGPQIDVVNLAEITLLEGSPFDDPLTREPLDGRGAQSSLAAEKLGERWLKVLGRDAAQVQDWQDFGDFWRAARPGRQDGAGETAALPSIVNTWRLNLQFAGGRRYLPRLADAIADDQGVPICVAMVGVLRDILIDLSLQGWQQHAAGTLAHNCIEIDPKRVLFAMVRSDYAQHAAYLFVDSLSAIRLHNQEGTPRSSPQPQSTTSAYIS
jgi:hypothetical protein